VLIYWLLFAYFAAGANLSPIPDERNLRRTSLLFLFGIVLVLLTIGLRYKVGADWMAYDFLFKFAAYADLGTMLSYGDPGYQALNWTVQQLGGKLREVNLLCALIFSWGLYRFSREQPDPWLSVLIAVPYLILVVAMGYTRQAVAIGILMAGLASVQRGGSIQQFAVYVLGAVLFHKTAVVVLPLVIFAGHRNALINAIAGLSAAFLLYDVFLAGSVDNFVRNYIEAEYTSQGAAIRVAMSVIPSVLFLLFMRHFRYSDRERLVWRNFSVAALLLLLALYVLPSSTVVDRLALYLLPLQMAVLSRAPMAFGSPNLGRLLVTLYAFGVQFVWLNFATHATYWLPYRFYPL
jgi:hypothetical protein